MTVDLAAVVERLTARRAELKSLATSTEDDRQPVELDQSRVGRLSRMDALQGQALAEATERRRQFELQKIDAALERVEAGDYGYCVTCGDEISAKRLELDPIVPTCIDCASAAEAR